MTIVYRQKNPAIFVDGVQVFGQPLYSGFGAGLNNPAMEAVPDVGPIPVGEWRIAEWFDHHGDKGPVVARLEPVGHNAHNRTDFLIHGPHLNDAMDSSHGCIIAPRNVRETLRQTNDMNLSVISGIGTEHIS